MSPDELLEEIPEPEDDPIAEPVDGSSEPVEPPPEPVQETPETPTLTESVTNQDGVLGVEPAPAVLPLETWQDMLARAGAPAHLSVLATDSDGRGLRLRITAPALHLARFAAVTLTAGGDGREWKYLGDGPDLETGQASCYVHVTLP